MDLCLLLVVMSRASVASGCASERKCADDNLLKLDRDREEEWSCKREKYSDNNNLSYSQAIESRFPLCCSRGGVYRLSWIWNIISTFSASTLWCSIRMILHVLSCQMLHLSNQVLCRVKSQNLLNFCSQEQSLSL